MTPLEAELQKPQYAGLSDDQAAAALNAPIVTGRRLVPLRDFVYRLFSDATWATLTITADTATDMGLKAAAITIRDYCRNPHVEHVDMDLAATKAALATLVAAGVFQQGLLDSIDALANITTSRARQLGFRNVNAAAVNAARGEE